MKKQSLSLKSQSKLKHRFNHHTGFTIVELLVVIVVIGILAAVTLVSYSGISQRAMVASLQSDLTNGSNKLKMYYTDNGTYPQSLDTNNCPVGPADTRYCLKPTPGNVFTYSSLSPYTSFTLIDTNTASSTKYQITDSTGPVVVAANPCMVTGGTVTYSGSNTIRTFTSSGTLTVSGTNCTGISNATALIVAGGGSGGGGQPGGGGGGGGVLSETVTLSSSMPVTVGNGGIASGSTYTHGTAGGNSAFAGYTAIGGGYGGGGDSNIGGSGGSGGGGGGGSTTGSRPGGAGTSGQGYAGGANNTSSLYGAGGGGGAGAVGATGSTTASGGGGVGLSLSITGASIYYGGGGGGGNASSGVLGNTGGSGGGGNGGTSTLAAVAGGTNTGGGGGGGGYLSGSPAIGANGGSGIVIVSYPT